MLESEDTLRCQLCADTPQGAVRTYALEVGGSPPARMMGRPSAHLRQLQIGRPPNPVAINASERLDINELPVQAIQLTADIFDALLVTGIGKFE